MRNFGETPLEEIRKALPSVITLQLNKLHMFFLLEILKDIAYSDNPEFKIWASTFRVEILKNHGIDEDINY